jgi:predicted secreted Zn-dependent protease
VGFEEIFMRVGTRIAVFSLLFTLVITGSVLAFNQATEPEEPLKPTFVTLGAATTTPVKATSGGNVKQSAVTATPAAPICIPASLAPLPTAPSITAAQPGLHETPVATTAYTVYGNSLEQIKAQIGRCSPVLDNSGRYSANTSYSINWMYAFRLDENNLCSVTNVRVGLAITQQYPHWQPTQTNPALTNTWNSFMNSLASHENHHAELDRAYATTLLQQLQNFPATDCSNIADAVNAKARGVIANLDAANQDFDHQTQHGATQGAVL